MRMISFLSVVLVSTLVSAAESATSVTLEDGVKMEISGTDVQLLLQGKPIWARKIEGGTEGNARLTAHEIAGPATAVLLSTKGENGVSRSTVFVIRRGRTLVNVVWEGVTSLKGDIGERVGTQVRFEDLNRDGKPEIVVGEVSEDIGLCGKKRRPLLFRRVFDAEAGKFRPILARREGLEKPVNIDGVIRTAPATSSEMKTIFPDSASRSLGDGGAVTGISKPTAAMDGDVKTAWSPWPGNGAGEFATFRTASHAYGITEVGIRPLIGVYKKRPYDRPRTLLLTSKERVYRLRFGTDPVDSPESTYWFSLPQPLKSQCLSLIVESSFGPKGGMPLGLAEISVKTEIDGPDGLLRLAKDLGNERRRRQAAMLLKRAGKSSLEPLKKVWGSLDTPGRRLAVEVAAEKDPGGAVELLIKAALGADEVAKEGAVRGLKKVPKAAVTHLELALSSDVADENGAAIAVLRELDVTEALEVLAAHAGEGPKPRRLLIRGALRTMAGRSDADAAALWSAAADADSKGEWERAVDLIRVAASADVLHEKVFDFVERHFDSKMQFKDRYRLLSVLGQLGCDFPKTRLNAALSDDDPQIRAVALLGLGECRPLDDASIAALKAALGDATPPVRLAALSVAAMSKAAGKALGQIAELAKGDPWPRVRASAVAAVFGLKSEDALPILQSAENDASAMVRKAALEGAARFEAREADKIIENRLGDPKESSELKIKAAAAVGRRCQTTALPLLSKLLKIGAEPLADHEAVEIAVAAARAMGHIGTPEAKEMLEEARKRSNPATDKAIDAALKRESSCVKFREKETK